MGNFLTKVVIGEYDNSFEDLIYVFLNQLKWSDVGEIYSCSLSGRRAVYGVDNILIKENCSVENEIKYNELRKIICDFLVGITPNGYDWYRDTFSIICSNLRVEHHKRKIEPFMGGVVLEDIISTYTLRLSDEIAKSKGF